MWTPTLDATRMIENLRPDDLEDRRRSFRAGDVVNLHFDKVGRQFFGSAVSLGIAAEEWQDGSWMVFERRTAMEYMAMLASALAHPESHVNDAWFEGKHIRWVPATDNADRLLNVYVGASELPPDTDSLHALRVDQFGRSERLRAIVLDRLFPVPAEPVKPEQARSIREDFGLELRRFRTHIERILLDVLQLPTVAEQIRAIDLLGDEMEDEIRDAERVLLQAGIARVTRSTVVQLARSVDPTGTIDRVAQGVEDVIGGPEATVGPSCLRSVRSPSPRRCLRLRSAAVGDAHRVTDASCHVTAPPWRRRALTSEKRRCGCRACSRSSSTYRSSRRR